MTASLAVSLVSCELPSAVEGDRRLPTVPVAPAVAATSGAVSELSTPPPDVTLHVFESGTRIFAFLERPAVALPSDLTVHISVPGLYKQGVPLTPTDIPAGTKINSYFIHSDAPGTDDIRLEGSITLEEDVLGLIIGGQTIHDTDALLGAPGTVYPTGVVGRGIDFRWEDRITLSADRRTVSFFLLTNVNVDQARVITLAQREVAIDIRPGSDPNVVNPKSRSVLPVAILSTQTAGGESLDFDAADVDPATITLGDGSAPDAPVAERGNGRLMANLEDVDHDGDLDLSLKFYTRALVDNGDLTEDTAELALTGETKDGAPIHGTDGVKIVGGGDR